MRVCMHVAAHGLSGTYISLNTTSRDTGPYLGGWGGGGGGGLKRKIFFSIDNATQQLQLMNLFLASNSLCKMDRGSFSFAPHHPPPRSGLRPRDMCPPPQKNFL